MQQIFPTICILYSMCTYMQLHTHNTGLLDHLAEQGREEGYTRALNLAQEIAKVGDCIHAVIMLYTCCNHAVYMV